MPLWDSLGREFWHFAVALSLAIQDRVILGIDTFRAVGGLVAQLGATVFLALELAVARREYREV